LRSIPKRSAGAREGRDHGGDQRSPWNHPRSSVGESAIPERASVPLQLIDGILIGFVGRALFVFATWLLVYQKYIHIIFKKNPNLTIKNLLCRLLSFSYN